MGEEARLDAGTWDGYSLQYETFYSTLTYLKALFSGQAKGSRGNDVESETLSRHRETLLAALAL